MRDRINNTIECHYQVATRLYQLMMDGNHKAQPSPRLNGDCRDAVAKIATAMMEELSTLEPHDCTEAPAKYKGRKELAKQYWQYLVDAAKTTKR